MSDQLLWYTTRGAGAAPEEEIRQQRLTALLLLSLVGMAGAFQNDTQPAVHERGERVQFDSAPHGGDRFVLPL